MGQPHGLKNWPNNSLPGFSTTLPLYKLEKVPSVAGFELANSAFILITSMKRLQIAKKMFLF
jgi:hypothetical protein